ncbi:hypothetical protein JTE90_024681, partial [Oedothorax gibbosus]
MKFLGPSQDELLRKNLPRMSIKQEKRNVRGDRRRSDTASLTHTDASQRSGCVPQRPTPGSFGNQSFGVPGE